MQENPYAALADLMRQTGKQMRPAVYRLGMVVRLSPLAVGVGDILLEGKDLLVNADLRPRQRSVALTNGNLQLKGLQGSFKGSESGGGGTAGSGYTIAQGELSATGGGTAYLQEQNGGLVVGDRVVLLTSDDQVHIVLCKAVDA